MKLILNEDEPIFIQISKAIEDEILTDSIKEDEQVPSTTELSRLYNINPATVLKDKNILYKKRGLGMFVNRGAKNTIKLLRKESFKNKFIKNLIEEANKLDIDKDELLEMIKQYKGGN